MRLTFFPATVYLSNKVPLTGIDVLGSVLTGCALLQKFIAVAFNTQHRQIYVFFNLRSSSFNEGNVSLSTP